MEDCNPYIFDNKCNSQLRNFVPLAESEKEKMIKAAPNKHCASDPIPTSLVKHCAQYLTPVIMKIVNESILTNTVPDTMKGAIVTPLIKKSNLDPDNLKNYRPVSNLSFISKLLERAVSVQLSDYKDDNNLREVRQSAYRKNHSTETAMLRLCNDILCEMDQGQCTLLVMLDLSAAFDTVDHKIILNRLDNNFGIKHNALEWIESYFSFRTQEVVINGIKSDKKVMKCNVPQGSVLGAPMYSDYTEPVGRVIRALSVEPYFYADDSQSSVSFQPGNQESQKHAISAMESSCDEVKTWMRRNMLKLNDDKTEVMVFGSKHQLKQVNINHIRVGDSNIALTESAVNIGVTLDSNLSMIKHVNKIVSTAWYHLRNISKIRKFLTQSATETIIHAFITSRLDTCNCILYGITDKTINKLQVIQNKCAKVIVKANRYSSATDIRKTLNWLPIKQRIKFKILVLTFKCLNGMAPVYLTELLSVKKQTRALRPRGIVLDHKTFKKTTQGGRSFSSAAPTLWNKLPIPIREIKTIIEFKSSLKTFLYQEAYP